jgi:hypothetical protein
MSEGTFKIMQVCLSGHRINSNSLEFPVFNKAFCPDCGEPTITACPECQAPIKGSLFSNGDPPVLPFCDVCGMAYPWQIARVANAVELLRLEGIPEADVQDIARDLPDITRDTPRSQVAALHVRRMLAKAGKPLYDIGIKVVGDVATAVVKAHLGLPPR